MSSKLSFLIHALIILNCNVFANDIISKESGSNKLIVTCDYYNDEKFIEKLIIFDNNLECPTFNLERFNKLKLKNNLYYIKYKNSIVNLLEQEIKLSVELAFLNKSIFPSSKKQKELNKKLYKIGIEKTNLFKEIQKELKP